MSGRVFTLPQHQIRITNTTANTYNDNIYVTALNVFENILVADNYSITQLTVTETQYIAVPDVFKVSNLSVTATPGRGGLIGLIKSNFIKHVNEATHEKVEQYVEKDFNKMHESNSDDFLRKETIEPKNTKK